MSNGEVYHRNCVYWTASLEEGKCAQCAEAIPDAMLRLARAQREERARRTRDRDVERLSNSTTQRVAEIQAMNEAKRQRRPTEILKK